MRLLVVEDEVKLARSLQDGLTADGFSVDIVHDGADALWMTDVNSYDAIVLDIMLPGTNGFVVCRTLCEREDWTPILMLTARQETPDRVAGLDAGADDYLAKPFELDELLARVRALLRRTDHSDSVTLTCGDLLVDPAKRLVTRDGDTIELTRTEFDILHTLITNAEIVMSRSQLYETIWGYDFETNSKSLDVHIGYLRRKLEEGDRERLVHTVRGIGYVVRSSESNT